MLEKTGWIGEFEIICTYKDGTVTREKIKNRLTNAGLNLLRDFLNGEIADGEIKYLALGTSDAVLDDTDTQLGTEGFRTTFVSTVKPAVGQLQKTALVLDAEAVFHIKEIGIFAGAAAGAGANSGVMISRVLYDRDKTNLESIQFVRLDTIGRG